MKRSIAWKLFAAALGIFLLVLVAQLAVISRYFNEIYRNSVMASHRQLLRSSIEGFSGGTEDSADPGVRHHFQETGSPVLVITEDYKIVDRDFMSRLQPLSVRLNETGLVRLPTAYLWDAADQPSLMTGRRVELLAVRLGNSDYYEPLSITMGGIAYTNRSSLRDYRLGDDPVDAVIDRGTVARIGVTLSPAEQQARLTQLMYDNLKDCLIRRLPPEPFLEELNRESLTLDGRQVQFYWDSRVINGLRHYFITARTIIITGEEQAYVNRFFLWLYAVLGLFLIIVAYVLSRYISRPLIHLSQVTRRIADLDFSAQARIKSRDEVGQLSQNINEMSDNLQQAMTRLHLTIGELEATSRAASENEARMRTLLSDLAHEFKTPLFIISSHTEALEANLSRDKAAAFYSTINSEIDKLNEMVNEVIELSRLQSGNWLIRIEPWDLRDIILATLDKFDSRFRQEGFTVTTDLVEATVLMDARRIEQVLANFLSNAMKYCDENRRIEVVTAWEKDGRITVGVGNSGQLTEQERMRIWERYYTSGPGIRVRLPSEGIGLDIAKSILTAHDSEHGVRQKKGMIWFFFTLRGIGSDPG